MKFCFIKLSLTLPRYSIWFHDWHIPQLVEKLRKFVEDKDSFSDYINSRLEGKGCIILRDESIQAKKSNDADIIFETCKEGNQMS